MPSSRFFPADPAVGRWLASSPTTVRPPGDAEESTATELRIAARRLDDGRTEFTLQQRGAQGEWGERILPRSRFFPAEPSVGVWLTSSPLTLRAPGADEKAAGLEARIAAQRLSDGRTEFALQLRDTAGEWGERLLPGSRFFPDEPAVERWLTSSPLTVTVPRPEPAPAPTATPLPTPTATATPVSMAVATAHLSEIIPWFSNPPDYIHSRAAETITGVWLRDPEIGSKLARLPWVTDGVSNHELPSVISLAAIAEADPDTARSVLNLQWVGEQKAHRTPQAFNDLVVSYREDPTLAEGKLCPVWTIDTVADDEIRVLAQLAAVAETAPELANRIAGSEWFADGVDTDNLSGSEEVVLASLSHIAGTSPELARLVSEFPWVADEINRRETLALLCLAGTAWADLELAISSASSPWIEDEIGFLETYALNSLLLMANQNSELARFVLAFSAEPPVRDSDVAFIPILFDMSGLKPEQFEHLIGQPWFDDGLDSEERAFLVTLQAAIAARDGNDGWFYDLVQNRFTLSESISLPLAGEIRLRAFQHTPFPSDEDLAAMVGEAVRGAEGFMRIPFPMNDINVLFLDESRFSAGIRGIFLEDHVLMARAGDNPVASHTVYHELAHYYFPDRIGPAWLSEGGAELIAFHIRDLLGIESLEDQLIASAEPGRQHCVDGGFENIHGLNFIASLDDVDFSLWDSCHSLLGRHFLMSMYVTVGEEATSSALRELHLRSELNALPATEEDIYRAFLENTAPELKEGLRNMYRRLHGGPFTEADD